MPEDKRSKMPPTPKQIERIEELIEHEAITPHLDSIMKNFEMRLRTRGGAGVLLGWMKKEVAAWERSRTR